MERVEALQMILPGSQDNPATGSILQGADDVKTNLHTPIQAIRKLDCGVT
jgi:hypothetical protein